ncbi:hypothetical protein [Wenxinia saemankumensis]|uniref:Uncharacterized protein n=1 Tax=Wenxinia saemankumensis TaxID=1447782 RepID=A0A1M6CIY4_9RHOB|nr:hypothetical protein [Wenxinia saemankumensis]SHI61000.1 hypothetical protein SAMN05444417_1216 [Wenxinia saemankumensis]
MLKRNNLKLSAGERQQVQSYAAMALVSAFVGYVVVVNLDAGRSVFDPLGPYHVWLIVAATLGGVLGLHFVRSHLGHSGPRGWLRLARAIAQGTLYAGLFGGTLALPLYGTMFGPFTLLVTLAAWPAVGLMWVLIYLIAHLHRAEYQRERDSIFAWTPSAPATTRRGSSG